MGIAPLEDSNYEPEHPPVDGIIPEVVSKFGKNTQLRWFKRFRKDLALEQPTRSDEYYIESEHHKDTCCRPCQTEFEEGYGVIMDGWCCCRDSRITLGIRKEE